MDIILHTEQNPENNCMLSALYSRSSQSVRVHLEKLESTGSGKFMEQYYLAYNHGSIAESGSETLYFEGISMLAAKAIEDNNLFRGQECSSRYIDFSHQPFYNPGLNEKSQDAISELYDHYRRFYCKYLPIVKEHLKTIHKIGEGVKFPIYEKTIAAKAFDILRGWLPSGATTNVAWTGDLRNLGEHLIKLMHHPLHEVKLLASQAYCILRDNHKNSFREEFAMECENVSQINGMLLIAEGYEEMIYMSDLNHFYYNPFKNTKRVNPSIAPWDLTKTVVNLNGLTGVGSSIQHRTRKTQLPKHASESSHVIDVNTTIDFGSYRDIQRHRNGYCSMPALSAEHGVHPWYYDNLPDEAKHGAESLMLDVASTYRGVCLAFDQKPEQSAGCRIDHQHLLPMGIMVPVFLRYSLSQCVYFSEIRSGKTVHATLRPVAQEIGKAISSVGVPCFYDADLESWTEKRGAQDIVAKS
jgi:thymidylate synthase ThyX